MMRAAALGMMLAVVACATAPERVEGPGPLRPPPAPEASAWEDAWAAADDGRPGAPVDVGGWTVERLSGRGLTVYPRLQRVAGGTPVLGNAEIRAVVLARLGGHPETIELDVSVHADDGVVSLYGTVDSRAAAAAAVRVALATPGVREIRSYLRWRRD